MAILFLVTSSHVFSGEKLPEESSAKNQEKAREFFEKGLEAKELSEKESLYVKAIELWPSYPEAHNNLGDVYEKQGKYKDAIREYTLAATFATNAPYPYFGLGDVYFKLGRYEQAVVNYEKGLKLDPNDKESQENLKIAKVLSVKVLFPFDSDNLTDKAIEQLNAIAVALSSPKTIALSSLIMANTVFEIQGHTDNIGSENYNLSLSQRRTEMVKKYLVEQGGIKPDRLRVKGYAKDRPIADNGTKEGRQRNRRVDFK